jgi:hypothetical protein
MNKNNIIFIEILNNFIKIKLNKLTEMTEKQLKQVNIYNNFY